MISLLIWLLVFVVAFIIVKLVINELGLPDNIRNIVFLIMGLIALLIIISKLGLLNVGGGPGPIVW